MTTTYSTGTISVTAASTSVTGSGTSWLTAGLQPGDLLTSAGLTAVIASVNSNTSITLTVGWPGSTASGAAYAAIVLPPASRVLTRYNELALQFSTLIPAASARDTTAARLLTVGAGPEQVAKGALRATYGGSANAITLTTGAGISSGIPTGLQLRFRASAANTGATTIALDGGSAIACRTVTGVALPSGYIRTNAETVATFDGTFWVLNRAEERGSNANGAFTRFETGLLICEQTLTGINVDATFGQIFRSSVLTSWTYPAAFLTGPVIGGNAGDTGAWIGVGSSGASIAYLRFCGGVTLTGISPRLTATGPWY